MREEEKSREGTSRSRDQELVAKMAKLCGIRNWGRETKSRPWIGEFRDGGGERSVGVNYRY